MTPEIKKKRTLEEKLPLILAFGLPIVIMIAVLAGKSIYPFGDNSFLRTDMYHQYAPFFMNFMDKLKNGESLTYAWGVGLGSNYTALYAYYLSSPFNWLLILCPQSLVVEFMTYLIVLKIGLCGLTMAYYLSKRFNTRHMGIAFFGICYALSGYMAAYSWNIMWLDCLWLAPLILLGLERLVKEHKPFLYCVSLGLAILTNYYIAIMLCIFLLLYFICLIIMLPRQKFHQYLVKIGLFALYSLIAGGLAAVLLVPAARALMTTASADTTFPTSLTSYFSLFEMLSRHLVDVQVEIGLDHWPNIYCGVATLLFLPMYYLNQRIPYKEKIVKTVLMVFMLLSFSLNIPNYIWHGFHFPNSLPARQSFLYTILVLTMGFEGFKGFKGLSKGKLVACFWGAAAFILLAELLVDTKHFEYHVFYASLIFVALYALMLYLYKTRRMHVTTAIIAVMGILAVEMMLNTFVTSVTVTGRSEYWRYTQEYQNLLESIEDPNLFYRVEKDTRKTKNDAAWVGYQSASIFSSTTHAGVSDLYKKLGLEGNTNAYSYTGTTPFTSSLFSVRYTLLTEQLPDSSLYVYRNSEEGAYLYENLYTLPLGFMIPSDTNELWNFSGSDPAAAQNSLVNLTTDAGDILQEFSGTTSGNTFSGSTTEYGRVYVYVKNTKVDDVTATIGDVSKTFSNVKRGYLLDLGYCEAGTQFTLKAEEDETLTASAYLFNENAFITAYEQLNQQPLVLNNVTDTLTRTSLSGTVTAQADGTLFTSIPYEKGWTVTVDGAVAEAEAFADTFLTIPLTAGTHTIEMSNAPEGLKTGALLSGGSLVLLVTLITVAYIRRKKAAALPEDSQEETTPADSDSPPPSTPETGAEAGNCAEKPAPPSRPWMPPEAPVPMEARPDLLEKQHALEKILSELENNGGQK